MSGQIIHNKRMLDTRAHFSTFSLRMLFLVFIVAFSFSSFGQQTNEGFFIPHRSNQEIESFAVHSLSQAEFDSFVEKRKTILNRFSKVLIKLKFSPKTHNFLLLHIDESLLKKINILAKDLAKGFFLRFHFGALSGLNSRIANKLRMQGDSFGKIFGLGFGVKFGSGKEGEDRFKLYVFYDQETVNKTHTLALQLEAGIGLGLRLEVKNTAEIEKENRSLESTHISAVSMRSGKSFIEINSESALGIPPGLGFTAVFDTQIKRRELILLSVPLKIPSLNSMLTSYYKRKSICRLSSKKDSQ